MCSSLRSVPLVAKPRSPCSKSTVSPAVWQMQQPTWSGLGLGLGLGLVLGSGLGLGLGLGFGLGFGFGFG